MHIKEPDAEENRLESNNLWVEFGPDDEGEPIKWTPTRKFATSATLTLLTFVAYFVGFAITPLILAPMSEVYGRAPMYRWSSLMWLIFMVVTGVGKNIETVILGRLISGAAGATAATLVAGSIADLYEAKDRGRPMSLFAFGGFFGTGIGPLIFGYVAQNRSRRYIQYIQIAPAGACVVAMFMIRETRGPFILKMRAAALRKSTGDARHRSRAEMEHPSLIALLKVSLVRPLEFAATEPVVIAFSLWLGWSWGCAAPRVRGDYRFNVGKAGLTFVSLVIGSMLGFATNPIAERLYRKHHSKRGPEARLFVACVGGLCVPSGAFIFGFSQGRGHWMGPCVGITILTLGIYTVYVAAFSYLADCYKEYASSALAALSLYRNIFGVGIPLFSVQMYHGLGFQWASFFAGCLALALAAVPFALIIFGPRLRASSKAVLSLGAQ